MGAYGIKSIIGEIARGIERLIEEGSITKSKKIILYGLDRYSFAMRTILSNLGYDNIEGYLSDNETLVMQYQLEIHNFACRFLNHETDAIKVWTIKERLQPFDNQAFILLAVKEYETQKANLEELGYQEALHFWNVYDFKDAKLDAFLKHKKEMSLEEIKQTEKEILAYVDAFLREKNLRYWVCGGTLLGTIRHKGFIPWDDDIDIFLPWEDYLAFIERFQETERFALMGFGTSPVNDFPDPFAKVVDKRTIIVEDIGTLLKINPLCIDFFPLIGLPDDARKRQAFFAGYKELNRQIWQEFYATNGRTDLFPKWFEKQKEFLQKYEFDKAQYVGVLGTAYGEKDCTHRAVYDKTLRMPFEDMEVNVASGYEEYLDHLYGTNWMQLPEESQRKTHHHASFYWNKKIKYLIFGTGEYYTRYQKWFEKEDIIAFLDNAPNKQNTSLDGIPVVSPIQGVQMEYDAVMILSVHVKAMKQQLLELGVPSEKIYHYYDLHDLICMDRSRELGWYKKPIQVYGKVEPVQGGILLLSHDLELGGPALALSHMARVLKEYGKAIVVASEIDGPLREVLTEEGVPVVIDANLQIETMKEAEWTNRYALIVCNTMNFYRFLSERNTEIPVLWWLHDSLFFYDGVNREVMKKISFKHLKTVSVGPVPKEAIQEFLPGLLCEEFLYGVADTVNEDIKEQDNSKFHFITIGFLENRKGQDLLIQAIENLPENVRKKCEFLIVGHEKTLFGERIRQESEPFKEVLFTGSVNREKLHGLLARSDLMICPSREDPMPTVAAEAMMHSVPCLLSDAVGTAAYIRDGENGILFRSEDVQMLADKIEWCIEHKEQVKEMGKQARKLYETHFSMQVFEKRLFEILDEMLVKGSN